MDADSLPESSYFPPSREMRKERERSANSGRSRMREERAVNLNSMDVVKCLPGCRPEKNPYKSPTSYFSPPVHLSICLSVCLSVCAVD